MRRFNSIKKSRKKSKDIDEKIEYLNKECHKTGLNEIMTTSNIYVGSEQVPNTVYSDFIGIPHDGYGLALSGADGNTVGGATIDTIPYPFSFRGMQDVAFSPPHPVTGDRHYAIHYTTGLVTRLL